MTDDEMREYLDSYKAEHGETVELATLVGQGGQKNTYFEGFHPVYEPRGKPKDPVAAKDAAILRAVNTLYLKLRDDPKLKKLAPVDANDWVDFHRVALPFLGGKSEPEDGKAKRGRNPSFKSLPNWRIKLEDAFFAFVQDLPSNIGGRKAGAASGPKRSPEAQKRHDEFTGALRSLKEKPSRTTALAFLHVYDKYQAVMRLPKFE